MNGRVVRPDFDLLLRIERPHKVLLVHGELRSHLNGIDVEYMLYVRADTGKLQAVDSLQAFGVLLRNLDAARVQRIQFPQLNQANRGLYALKTIVEANTIEIEIPIFLAHGLDRLVDREIFPLGVVGTAAQRAVREH